jgi:hypothetical protein
MSPFLSLFLLLFQFSAPAFAMDIQSNGGGHDVPTPFEDANRHFELANGEIYSLVGKIIFLPDLTGVSEKDRPYFQVDLKTQPCLAHPERQASPFYLLEGPDTKWRNVNLTTLRLFAKAHGRVIPTPSGATYQISLESDFYELILKL